MSESNKQLLLKTCEIMQYWEYMDCNELAVIISRIKTLTNLRTYCIINHTKDVLPSGEPKKPHFHAILTFHNSKTIDSIAKAIHVENQYVNKIRTTTKTAQLYLIHRNNPEKYQYEPSEVVANFDYENFVDDCPIKEKRENIAYRIETGEIKEYNLIEYITVDEYARNKKYYMSCFEYRQNKLKKVDRNMTCLYICGKSGVGKTTLAKEIAKNKGYSTYIASGGRNPFDDYKGQDCIILDDCRSTKWDLTDFLKLTDNNTDSLVGCRYYNKSIAECKMLILTSIHKISDFYDETIHDKTEEKHQLFRRFPLLICMTEDKMEYYQYSETLREYNYCFTTKNVISTLFNEEKAKQFANDIRNTLGLEIDETKSTI